MKFFKPLYDFAERLFQAYENTLNTNVGLICLAVAAFLFMRT